jgi:DNA-binding NarL/FixJ family response regulator
LTDLEQHVDASPDHLLRLGQAKLVVAERVGHLSEALASSLAVEPLLDQVNDPFIRTGFLNNLSHALGLAARYPEAEDAARRQLDEAKHFRPTFAVPAGLINLAVAHLGLGSLSAAVAVLEQAETNDSALRIKRDTVRACVALARGDSHRAVADLRAMDFANTRSDLVSEALAVLALAEACVGDRPSAEASITAATAVPTDVAPTVFASAAAAILACDDSATVLSGRLEDLSSAIGQTGNYDSLICALRGSAHLLAASLDHSDMRAALRVAAVRSGDAALASALGLRPPKSRSGLSSREIEVLKLASEGFNNAQIGERLFISPKTVKTHLQNIYEKLDARSRTEAAMKAKEAGLLG